MYNREFINLEVRRELLNIADRMAQVLEGREKVYAVLALNAVKIDDICQKLEDFQFIETLNDQQAQNAVDYFTLVLQGMEQFLKENGMEV